MERETVEAAVMTLQSRGERVMSRTVRTMLGRGSFRDIHAHLRELGTEDEEVVPEEKGPLVRSACGTAATVPLGTTPAEPPPTWLAAAEERLSVAIEAENAARRAYDFAPGSERDSCGEVLLRRRRERNQAEQQVMVLRRGKENLIHGIQDGRVALRYAQSELEQAEETARSTILRARRHVEQTEGALARMITDLTTIAGAEAIPPTP